jgi:hypothetical protein
MDAVECIIYLALDGIQTPAVQPEACRIRNENATENAFLITRE